MINPPMKALRRRALELRLSAARERAHDLDSGSLMMFYAAECALKHAYMMENGLKNTSDSRSGKRAASDFKHNLMRLIEELRIPRSQLAPPVAVLQRVDAKCELQDLHQAWRYGEKVADSDRLFVWLENVANYCESRE